jgi:hypothetical protein
MHIPDHVHEWHRRRSLCKDEATPQQCLNWFLKSLVSLLEKDVASTFPQSKEESINKAQQFELIYSQLNYLYTVLPDAARPVPFGQEKPRMSHSMDGLIGTMTHHNLPPPTTTYVWNTSIFASIWRIPLLSSSPLSTTIPCSPTHKWTPADPHDTPGYST